MNGEACRDEFGLPGFQRERGINARTKIQPRRARRRILGEMIVQACIEDLDVELSHDRL
jgi:hypothetical protein